MKHIVVGFSRPKKFKIFSYLIRLFEKTEYSHVYIKWYSESFNTDIIYQASSLQVNFMGGDIFRNHTEVTKEFELQLDNNNFKNLIEFCIKKSGTPYGVKQVFGILFAKLFNLNRNILADSNKDQVCSELVGYILKDFFQYEFNKDLDLITPKDIYKTLEHKEIYG